MATHVFGGDWTRDKLERVRKYLCAYTRIFKSNPRAAYYTTIYVDAFAGTGEHIKTGKRRPKQAPGGFFPDEPDIDTEAFQKGSARIALEVEPPFDRFLFIEHSAKHVAALEKLQREFEDRSNQIQIQRGDANDLLKKWCQHTDWQRHRAVVFLDPYGMQVDWTTLEAIAKTKAVDLWLLFPLGMAINRLLTRNEPPPQEWADALTRIFGTEDWKSEFYAKKTQPTLFGPEETERKDTDFSRIGRFFLKRLRSLFAQVAPNPLVLENSTGVPIYLLCFAVGNLKGAPTAVKIAMDILE
jgi:three-Cys-motif partner protein